MISNSPWGRERLLLSVLLCFGYMATGLQSMRCSPKNSVYSYINRRGQRDIATGSNSTDCSWRSSALAGALSCSIAHSLLTPLDIVKTKLQTNFLVQRDLSIIRQLISIIRHDGISALFTGVSATASGYFLQGAFNFGLYDYFKTKLITSGHDLDVPILMLCSGAAEAIASVSLCPLEVLKIYMMMHPEVASKGMVVALRSIVRRDGGVLSLFRGLPLVVLRQVPYTCVKLVGYDIFSGYFRRRAAVNRLDSDGFDDSALDEGETIVDSNPRQKLTTTSMASSTVSVPLISGVVAGLCAAVISQPADVLLSKVCGYSAGSPDVCLTIVNPADLWKALRDLGLEGCFCGLRERSLMVASMTAVQFTLYESIKSGLFEFSSRTGELSYVQ